MGVTTHPRWVVLGPDPAPAFGRAVVTLAGLLALFVVYVGPVGGTVRLVLALAVSGGCVAFALLRGTSAPDRLLALVAGGVVLAPVAASTVGGSEMARTIDRFTPFVSVAVLGTHAAWQYWIRASTRNGREGAAVGPTAPTAPSAATQTPGASDGPRQ